MELIEQGHNVIIVGVAGTGKSHLLRQIAETLQKEKKHVCITCSTGIATENFITTGATTLHAWSGIGTYSTHTHLQMIRDGIYSQAAIQRIKDTEVLMLDECSMMSAEVLDRVEVVCRTIRNNNTVFGGIQVVLSGDFWQLPPVASSNDRGTFCFSAKSTTGFHVHKLTHVFRQDNPEFITLIRETARGELSDRTKEMLNYLQRPLRSPPEYHIFGTNLEIDIYNAERLFEMEGDFETFIGEDSRFSKYTARCQAPKQLLLKKGCPVIVLRNVSQELHNGSLGTFLRSEGQHLVIDVRGKSHYLSRVYFEEGRKQFPLKPAFGLTVHKSQGMTMGSVCIHGRNIHYPGQLSVALGRVAKFADVQLVDGENIRCPKPPSEVDDFYKRDPNPPKGNCSCCRRNMGPIQLLEAPEDGSSQTDTAEESTESADSDNDEGDTFWNDDSWNGGVQTLQKLVDNQFASEEKKDAARSLITAAENKLNEFHKKYTNLFSSYAVPLSQSAGTQKMTNFMREVYGVMSSSNFAEDLGKLFQLPQSKLTKLHRSIGSSIAIDIRKSIIGGLAEDIKTKKSTCNQPPKHLHPTTCDGRGNLRYVAGACLFRVKNELKNKVQDNLYNKDRSYFYSLLHELHFIDTLTPKEEDIFQSSTDPGSLNVTSFRQNANRPLLNISDSCFHFFLLLDKKRLLIQTTDFINKFGSNAPIEIKKLILCDSEISSVWQSVALSQDYAQLMNVVVQQYLSIATNEYRKTLLTYFNRKKKKAHRTQILINESSRKAAATSACTAGFAIPVPLTPRRGKKRKQDHDTSFVHHDLSSAELDVSSANLDISTNTSNLSNICKLCGKKYRSRERWTCCDTCNRWLCFKCSKLTPKQFKDLSGSASTFVCIVCKQLPK